MKTAETLNPGGQNLPANVLLGSAGTGGGLYNSGGSASGSALANYSFNYTPDFILKLAAEPGWGHWELFGIGRSFRDRIYPSPSDDEHLESGSLRKHDCALQQRGVGRRHRRRCPRTVWPARRSPSA